MLNSNWAGTIFFNVLMCPVFFDQKWSKIAYYVTCFLNTVSTVFHTEILTQQFLLKKMYLGHEELNRSFWWRQTREHSAWCEVDVRTYYSTQYEYRTAIVGSGQRTYRTYGTVPYRYHNRQGTSTYGTGSTVPYGVLYRIRYSTVASSYGTTVRTTRVATVP